jgi:hypothetical protein
MVSLCHSTRLRRERHRVGDWARWLAQLEYRRPEGAWFGTALDPDGNYVQTAELTEAYWVARRLRHKQAGSSVLEVATVATRLPAQRLE